MFAQSHWHPFIGFQAVWIVRIRVLDFNEHVATIIFEAEGGEFGRRHGDSTTGFDRVQEEAGDGNRHGKTAKWRLEDGELPRICRRVR
jgi:hypothetical protein